MNTIKILVNELKKYGVIEVYYHILHRIMHDEASYTKMLQQKDKYILSISNYELIKEITSMYEIEMKHPLDLENPKKFSEKIQWLKIYDNTIEKSILSDKYLVREWIEQKIGAEHLVKLLGVWNQFEEIDFTKLPNRFCLKMNHGSGMTYVVKDKLNINIKDIQNLFALWLARPFYAETLELQYKNIPRKIIAEEYIEEDDGDLHDYKIHCFNGKPTYIQVIGNRNIRKHTAYEAFYDTNWVLQPMTATYPKYEKLIEKPRCLEQMIYIAQELSKEFIYVRVDLYVLGNDIIKFGEMTFTPASGFIKWQPNITIDTQIGAMIKLPI